MSFGVYCKKTDIFSLFPPSLFPTPLLYFHLSLSPLLYHFLCLSPPVYHLLSLSLPILSPFLFPPLSAPILLFHSSTTKVPPHPPPFHDGDRPSGRQRKRHGQALRSPCISTRRSYTASQPPGYRLGAGSRGAERERGGRGEGLSWRSWLSPSMCSLRLPLVYVGVYMYNSVHTFLAYIHISEDVNIQSFINKVKVFRNYPAYNKRIHVRIFVCRWVLMNSLVHIYVGMQCV